MQFPPICSRRNYTPANSPYYKQFEDQAQPRFAACDLPNIYEDLRIVDRVARYRF